MKVRLLDILACPWCGQPFEARSYDASQNAAEITDGILMSGCGRRFPIVRGIPRILENAVELFPGFVAQHAGDFPNAPAQPAHKSRTDAAIEKTRKSFGYQWTVFHEMAVDFRDNFLFYICRSRRRFSRARLGSISGAASAVTSTIQRSSAPKW